MDIPLHKFFDKVAYALAPSEYDGLSGTLVSLVALGLSHQVNNNAPLLRPEKTSRLAAYQGLME